MPDNVDDANVRHRGNENEEEDGRILGAMARMERATSNVNVKDFDSKKDDFEKWVSLFEKAVMLATNVRERNQASELYKLWLPLKLDEHARGLLDTIDANATWDNTKNELTNKLIDPQDKIRWQSKLITVKWDGSETIYALSNRIIRAVNKYERDMPQACKDREYFNRFLQAFKKPMRRFINACCPIDERTLESAIEAAQRYLLANADGEESEDRAEESQKAVTFASGNLNPDRATSLETAMAGMTTAMEQMAVSVRKQTKMYEKTQSDVRDLSDRMSALERDRKNNRSRDQSRDRYNNRSTSRDRDRNRSRDRYDDRDRRRSRDRYNDRPRTPSRDRDYRRSDNRRDDNRDSGRRDNDRDNDRRDNRRDDRRDRDRDDRRDNDSRRDNNSRRSDRRDNDRGNGDRNRNSNGYNAAILTEDEASDDDDNTGSQSTDGSAGSRNDQSSNSNRGN